jgi:hypothetical protein
VVIGVGVSTGRYDRDTDVADMADVIGEPPELE